MQGIKDRVGDDVKVVYAPWKSAVDGMELIQGASFPEGLKAEYFDNTKLQGTPKVRKEEWINFEPANRARIPSCLNPFCLSVGPENCVLRLPDNIHLVSHRMTVVA